MLSDRQVLFVQASGAARLAAREMMELAPAKSNMQVSEHVLLALLTLAPWACHGSALLHGVLRISLGLLAYLSCLMSVSSQLVSCQAFRPCMTAVDVSLLNQRIQL